MLLFFKIVVISLSLELQSYKNYVIKRTSLDQERWQFYKVALKTSQGGNIQANVDN